MALRPFLSSESIHGRQEVHATLIVDNLSKEYRGQPRREPPMAFGILPAALFAITSELPVIREWVLRDRIGLSGSRRIGVSKDVHSAPIARYGTSQPADVW